MPKPTATTSVNIRKIQNGYLVTTCSVRNGNYSEKQRYIKTLPKLR